MDIDHLDQETLNRLALLADEEKKRRRKSFPADHFPWHSIQRWLRVAPGLTKKSTRVMMIAGGNRGGKTKVGMGIYSDLLRRKSPLNRQLQTTNQKTGLNRRKNLRDPLTIWVVPPTLEKARQDWILPQDGMGLEYWAGNLFVKLEQSPDLMVLTRPPGVTEKELWQNGVLNKKLCDKTLIKSQDQKLETFESSEVDAVFFDEEVQKEEIWNSCLLRVGTTSGVIIMTFTPLHGISWSYRRYWKPYVEHGVALSYHERCWIYDPDKGATVIFARMGSADNPRAKEYADEIRNDPEMSQAEKDARLDGKYGYVEGTLLPALAGLDVKDPLGSQTLYVVDTLPGMRSKAGEYTPGKIVQWFLVTDPNKSYGAILSAVDTNGNLYFVAEHLRYAWPDRKHAQAFKEMERSYATGHVARYADPGSAGAHSIVNMADLGMNFMTMPKGAGSVANSIKKLRGMTYVDPEHRHPITGKLGAPRLYFFRPGMVREVTESGNKRRVACLTAEQLSLARQTDDKNQPPDTPHKDIRSKLDLFDCARYTAVLAAELQIRDDQPRTVAVSRTDRIPTDASLFKDPDAVSPIDRGIYTPTYEFA